MGRDEGDAAPSRDRPLLYWLRTDPDDASTDAEFRRSVAALARDVLLAHGTDPASIDPFAAPGPTSDPRPRHNGERGAIGEARAASEPLPHRGPSPAGGAVRRHTPWADFDVRSTAPFLLDLAGRAVRAAVGGGGAPAGRGTLDTVLLLVAGQQGGIRLRALARRLALPDTTVTSTVTRLAREGLVERRRLPGDRRQRVVTATPEGRIRAERVGAAWRQADDRLLDGLTVSERDELCRLLRRAASTLSPDRTLNLP